MESPESPHLKDAEACTAWIKRLTEKPPKWLSDERLLNLLEWLKVWETHWLEMARVYARPNTC